MPISSSIVTDLLNKVKNYQSPTKLSQNVVTATATNFYSDDEDDEVCFITKSHEKSNMTYTYTNRLKKCLKTVLKLVLYVICLPFMLICDLLNTFLKWNSFFLITIKTSKKWNLAPKEWFEAKLSKAPKLQPLTRRNVLKLTLVILLFCTVLFITLYIWRSHVQIKSLGEVFSTINSKSSSLFSMLWSVVTGMMQCMFGLLDNCFYGFKTLYSLDSTPDSKNNIYQTTQDFQNQFEVALDQLLKNEKFAIRIKEEAKKIDDSRLTSVLSTIKEHENLLNNLVILHKEEVYNQQKEIKNTFQRSKDESEKTLSHLSEHSFPEVTRQIKLMELKIQDEENNDNQRFEILQNGVQEIREQLKQINQQQTNNSETLTNHETDLHRKLDDLELRLNNLASAHAQLSQTIADCSRAQKIGPVDISADENLLKEKINQALTEIFDENTAIVDPESNTFKVRELISNMNLKNTQANDMVLKDQLDVQINEASKKWKHDILSEIQTDLSKSLATGGNTDKLLRETIEQELNQMLKNHQMQRLSQEMNTERATLQFSEEDVSRIIKTELVTYDADKTGKFDFALESAGGTIASTRCTQTYDAATAVYSIWGIPIWWESVNGPRAMLQPGANPGQCWAVKGDGSGVSAPAISVVVRLSDLVKVQSVTLEHIPETLSPDGNIRSAPKEFTVFGLTTLNDPNPVLLGNFTYKVGNRPVQTFKVGTSKENEHQNTLDSDRFTLIELKVNSNYGNPNYTCIYRFRVHGDLATDEKSNLR